MFQIRNSMALLYGQGQEAGYNVDDLLFSLDAWPGEKHRVVRDVGDVRENLGDVGDVGEFFKIPKESVVIAQLVDEK